MEAQTQTLPSEMETCASLIFWLDSLATCEFYKMAQYCIE